MDFFIFIKQTLNKGEMYQEIVIENAIKFVKEILKNAEGGHDWFHINRVLKNVPERKVNLEFITALFNNVLDNSKWADELIEEHLQNWEFDRVAKVDKVLLKMGICEIYFLEDIPPKVTISEMVEISKVYSTDESPNFINGILDAVYKDFQKKGKN
jgi:transcription antitermination factor NusB